MSKTPSPTLMTVVLSAAAALGYLAYRLALVEEAPPAASTVPAESAPAPRKLADALPEFSLDDLQGRPVPIDNWPGKPLLVNFWATWCAPCLREIPLLKEFQASHPELQVVGIAVDSPDPVSSFAEEMQFNYPVLVGQSDAMEAAAAFGVQVLALPFTVFASGDGHILGVHTGEIHAEHLDNLAAVLADLEAQSIDVDTARERLAGLM